jgi:hypothetical protein
MELGYRIAPFPETIESVMGRITIDLASDVKC